MTIVNKVEGGTQDVYFGRGRAREDALVWIGRAMLCRHPDHAYHPIVPTLKYHVCHRFDFCAHCE